MPLAWSLPLTQTAAASASLGPANSFGAANAAASTTLTGTTATASGSGDLLVATVRDRSTTGLATVTGVTDSAGSNTWTKAAAKAQGSQADEEIWYAAGAASVTTVTVTVSTAAAISMTVVDLAGAASAPLDVTQTNGGSGTAASSGTTAAISQASEIVVAAVGWNASPTPSAQTAGYTTSAVEQSTASGDASGEQAAWELASASGTQTYGATLSVSTTWTGAIAAFKVATGPPPPPTITSFSPTSGPVGTPVVINGTGFTGATAVHFFNNQTATYTVDSDIKISTTVPSGATTGVITVNAPGGNVNSSTSFTVTVAPPPTISSFSPTSGPVGTPVVINGTGFTGATAVHFFNNQTATYTVDSDIKISTTVPSGATTGIITVNAPGGNVNSSTSFTVTTSTPHVLIIVEENQEYSSIVGNTTNAPYINSLVSAYRSATQWYGVQRNSPFDYMELLSGSSQGWPVGGGTVTASALVDELHAHNTTIPWKAYMESMPSDCYTGASTTNGLYDVIHNPFRYFTRYSTSSGDWCSSGNATTEGVLVYPGSGTLVTTLDGSQAPDFVWITPNDCNNMHGDSNTGSTCKGVTGNPLIKAGDTWLSSNLAPVLASNWFKQNGTVIVTWDEGTTNKKCCGGLAVGGHIPTLVISSTNAGKGTFTTPGDHYGTLRGIEEAYGVTRLGGSANIVNGDLGGAF